MKLSNDAKLSILTVICLLGSAVVFKNILHIPPPPGLIISYGPAEIFVVYILLKCFIKESDWKPLYDVACGMAIIFVTLATIILYAFF
jgi:hypothetical protein